MGTGFVLLGRNYIYKTCQCWKQGNPIIRDRDTQGHPYGELNSKNHEKEGGIGKLVGRLSARLKFGLHCSDDEESLKVYELRMTQSELNSIKIIGGLSVRETGVSENRKQGEQ